MTRNEFLLKLLQMECLKIDKTPFRITADIFNVEEEEALRANLSLEEERDEEHYSIFKWNRNRRWHQVTRGAILKTSYEVLYEYVMLHFEDMGDQEKENDEYIKNFNT